MARDRLAAMRAQQASAAGGYSSPGARADAGAGAGGSATANAVEAYGGADYEQEYGLGAGNNGYGDHLFPTQQSTGVPYEPPSQQPSQLSASTAAYAQPSQFTAAPQPTPPKSQKRNSRYAQQQQQQYEAQLQLQSQQQAAQQQQLQVQQAAALTPQSYGNSYEMSSMPARTYTSDQTTALPAGGTEIAGMHKVADNQAVSKSGGAYGTAYGPSTTAAATTATTGYGGDMGYSAAAPGGGAASAGDAYAVNMSSDPASAWGANDANNTNTNTFFGRITEIQDTIRQIDLNVNRISDLHSRSLNNVGEAAQLAAESELASVAQQTSMYTNFVKTSIKSLEAEANKMPASGPAPEGVGRSVRLTQIGAVKNRFKETIMRYQEVEKAYRTKYRQRTERQLRIVKPDATQAEIQSALEGETGGQQIFSQALMNSNRQGEARGALREVQERHSDIQRIERTITELAALFQEMSILVEQQDEQLNVIKDHAQHTEQEVAAGRQQTDKAVVAARRRRKRRWICFWLLIVIIIIVIAAVVGGVCGHGDTCNPNSN